MQYDDILKKLKSLSNPKAIEGMAKYGITAKRAYGVSIPNLRKIAKKIGKNHELAQKLWKSDIRETRILVSMIDDPDKITEEQMERYVKEFNYWEICDQFCMNLFDKTKFAYKKAIEWSKRKEEFVKRAGFALVACLAWHDKNAKDSNFLEFFSSIVREATDNRNYVKKAVNWALRNIGKRNLNLNRKAVGIAKEIKKMDSKAARWIASDAIRELTSEKIQKRLAKKV
ncbi:MAG: DNA alkylation repair protein [Actinobacteria bacterium]|nr:DNA alkylation repair protein [Actinomycetota bacterium]